MSVRMRHTKGHTGNRRSHHALKEPALATCADCQAPHVRHQVCMACGKYRGRQVLDVAAKTARDERRRVAKMKARGLDPDMATPTQTAQEEEETSEEK